MAIEKILIVDDEMLIRNFLNETLLRKDFDVSMADCGEKAVELLKEKQFDLVITDMKMPGMTGIDVLKKVKKLSPSTIVIVVTAFGSIENSVEAMRLGAFTYLIKPFSPDTIEAIIAKAQEHSSLVEENQYLRQQVNHGNSRGIQRVVGESACMKKILAEAQQVAKSQASVFICGESGTGKEVIAHTIHFASPRAKRPYIRVNCAAVPETLIESEFFGHEKGAFTGAAQRRLGRFELAHGGSLLLDEITEVPLSLQAKLLRVIQEKELERVGGSKLIKVDVRLISTSNRDMLEAIEEKVFREDLYYRLNVVPFHLPPLRDRRDDIVPLAEYFLHQMCIDNHKEQKKLSESAKHLLLHYPWPGNIRELANIIERTVVMDQSTLIEAEHLYLNNSNGITEQATTIDSPSGEGGLKPLVGMSLAELEKRLIIETLQSQNDNRTRTAEVLGISIRTLRNKLHEYNGTVKKET
ncbi:MAG: two-component system response regulator [Waddliaceae bacterium]|nr:two-component system response regulator [Waddliaceae bacterium]